MIELIRFGEAGPLALLQQILASEGIAAEVREQDGSHVLYLQDAENFAAARELVESWLANPHDPRFNQAAWQAGQALPVRSRQPLLSGQWWRRLGWLTRGVFVACVLVFLSPFVVGERVYLALLFPSDWAGLASQPWRLLSPMLLHFGALHIVFNLLWWLELGGLVEGRQAPARLLAVTLVTSAVANAAQFAASGPMFGGMSGVVYGLLGYLWMYGRVYPEAGLVLRPAVVGFMLVWLVICWVGLSGVVANEAHLGGLASGCVLGVLLASRDRWLGRQGV